MRFWLGGLLLVALFLLSTRLQERWTSTVRAERDAAFDRRDLPSNDDEPAWARVIVGRPSGADALPAVDESGPRTSAAASTPPQADARSSPAEHVRSTVAAAASSSNAVAPGGGKTWIVQPGQTLSEIVRTHYGSAPVERVRAVARANRLGDAGLVRAGAQIVLPPLAELDTHRR
ncbi:MAG: LysM peptidoglycan-binding domain-containing protein [Planctomycetota bacterium]